MSDSTRDSPIWKLVKSIIVPIDINAAKEVFKGIQTDASKTAWLKLLYRLEGVSALIVLPGLAGLIVLTAIMNGVGLGELRYIGLHYLTAIGILISILVAKVLVWIVHQINEGDSVLGATNIQSRRILLFRLTISVALIATPIISIYHVNLPMEAMLVLILVFWMYLALAIAGVAGVISTLILLSKTRSGR